MAASKQNLNEQYHMKRGQAYSELGTCTGVAVKREVNTNFGMISTAAIT